MGPTTRSKLPKKDKKQSTTSSVIAKNGISPESKNTLSRSTDSDIFGNCLLLAPAEFCAEKCDIFKLRCPRTGALASYVIGTEKETIWQIVRYMPDTHTSIWTTEKILSSSSPLVILAPVCAATFLLPSLLKSQDFVAADNLAANCENGLKILFQWRSFLTDLEKICDVEGSLNDMSSYRVRFNHEKFKKWIKGKALKVYNELNTPTDPGQYGRCEFSIEIIRQQIPVELHDDL